MRYPFLATSAADPSAACEAGATTNSSDEVERKSMHASTLRQVSAWKGWCTECQAC